MQPICFFNVEINKIGHRVHLKWDLHIQ